MSGITWQEAAAIMGMLLVSGGFMTYTDLFGTLFQLKGIDYSHSGDITCGVDCPSYINVNTSYWRVCFADYNNTKYENETLFKKVSRSRTLHVNMDKIDNIITTQKQLPNGSWIPYDIDVDWNVPARGKGNWRPIKDGDCWDRGKVNKIQLVGHKVNTDTIKWSFILDEYVDIDPLWNGVKVIGQDRIELDTKNTTCDGWHIEFDHVKKGLTEQVFDISIQNLYISKRDINLTQVLEPFSYDMVEANMTLYEWKGIPTIIPTYNYTNMIIEQNCTDDNISYYDCSYNTTVRTQNGTEEVIIPQWKEAKAQGLKETTAHKLKENMQLMNIPKFGSKYKEADETINGTKFFQVRIKTPITYTGSGWGSEGLYTLNVGNCVFYDAENSSWWNTTWDYGREIKISTNENKTYYQLLINITNKTNAQADCSDMRFTYIDNATKIPYMIEECNVSKSHAMIYIKVNVTTNNGSIMYWYGNNTGVVSESDGEQTFNFYDHFPGNSINASKWNEVQSGDIHVANSKVTMNKSANPASMIISKEFNVTDHIIEAYYQNDNTEITSAWAIRRDTNTSTDNSIFMDGQVAAWNNYNSDYYNRIMVDNSLKASNGTYVPTISWQYVRLTAHGTNLTSEKFSDLDFTVLLSDISYVDSGGLTTGFTGVGQWGGSKKVIVDWFRVRKYLAEIPTYVIGDEITPSVDDPPTVDLNTPVDNTNQTSLTGSFVFTPTDDSGFVNCSLWTNETSWSQKHINTSTINNGTTNTITEVFSAYDTYLWNVECYDNASQSAFASANFTINIGYLATTSNAPADNNHTSDQTPDFNFTVAGSSDTYSCELFLNDTGYGDNSSTLNNTATIITANATISDGSYNWYINCTAGGLYDESSTRAIVIDSTTPEIQFVSPTEVDNYNNSENYTVVNTTIIEINFDTLIFNWNSTNYTMYDDSLVLHMNLDNNSAIGENDTYAVDNTDINNGIINDANFTTSGNFGGAIDFDGSSGYIDCGNDSSLNLTDSITIEAWIYQTTQTSTSMIATKGTVINFGIDTAGRLTVMLHNGAYKYAISTETILLNTWTHVLFTYDKDNSTNKSYVYINGQEVAYDLQDDLEGKSLTSTESNQLIGKRIDGFHFNGTVDEVKIYNRALSADEVLVKYGTYLRKINSTDWYMQVNMTDQSDETYDYYVWINDTTGHSNQTETRTITIDTVLPTITVYYPTNTTYYDIEEVDLNWSTDEDLILAYYSLNDSNNISLLDIEHNATLSETTGANDYYYSTFIKGDYIYAGHYSGYVYVWYKENKSLVTSLHTGSFNFNLFVDDTHIYTTGAIGADPGIMIWNISGFVSHANLTNGTLWTMDSYVDSEYIYAPNYDGDFFVWNTADLSLNATINESCGSYISTASDSNYIYAGTYTNNTLYIHHRYNKSLMTSIDCSSPIYDIHVDDTYVYLALSTGIKILYVTNFTERSSITGTSLVRSVFADSTQIYAVDEDGQLLISHIDDLTFPINKTVGSAQLRGVYKSGEYISVASRDGNVYVYDQTFVEENTTIDVDEGHNNIIVYITDMAGNANQTTVYFTVENTSFIVTYTSGENLQFDITNYDGEFEMDGQDDDTPGITFNNTGTITIDINMSVNTTIDGCLEFWVSNTSGLDTAADYNITNTNQTVLTSFEAEVWCYQETANVSTNCGGLDTGSYDFTDVNWSNPGNVIDGDWDTHGERTGTNSVYGYFNYTKPLNALNTSTLQIRSGISGCYRYQNETIPTDCWNQDPLQFKVITTLSGSQYSVYWQCLGSSWITMEACQAAGAEAVAYVYEEAMWWKLTTNLDYLWGFIILDQCTVGDTFRYKVYYDPTNY